MLKDNKLSIFTGQCTRVFVMKDKAQVTTKMTISTFVKKNHITCNNTMLRFCVIT
jgi:hypothetical protein